MTERVHNFSAGPCTLPLSVLEEGQAEFVDYDGAGMSLIEMSHRGKHFVAVHEEAGDLVRTVYGVPDEFDVLFLQGRATLQFAMVPMNLLKSGEKGAYVNSGTWAKGAMPMPSIMETSIPPGMGQTVTSLGCPIRARSTFSQARGICT